MTTATPTQPTTKTPLTQKTNTAATIATTGALAAASLNLAALIGAPLSEHMWGGRAHEYSPTTLRWGSAVALVQLGLVTWSIQQTRKRLNAPTLVHPTWFGQSATIATLFGISTVLNLAAHSTIERTGGTAMAFSICAGASYLAHRCHQQRQSPTYPLTYRFTLDGVITADALGPYANDFTLKHTAKTTILHGPITDVAHLHGTIAGLQNRDLPLVDIRRVRSHWGKN